MALVDEERQRQERSNCWGPAGFGRPPRMHVGGPLLLTPSETVARRLKAAPHPSGFRILLGGVFILCYGTPICEALLFLSSC